MINDLQLLKTLNNSLNNCTPILNNIIELGKDLFSSNEEHIIISIGLINEIREITLNLSDDLCFVNKSLYNSLQSISSYSSNAFNKYKLVNTHKLYDCLKIDVFNLIDQLNLIFQ